MRELLSRRRPVAAAVLLTAAILFTVCSCSQGYARSRKRPFGFLESPGPGAVAKTPYGITGWALSEAGIREVWVFLDRKFYAPAQLKALRTDISKAYPNLPNSNRSGFGLELDIFPLKNGPHEITVQAVGNNGMIADIGTAVLVVAHPEETKNRR